MKKYCAILLILVCSINLFSVMAYADQEATGGCWGLFADQTLMKDTLYDGSAKAVMLFERNTNTLVYAYNPDMKINPTGLVKLLTALIAFEEGNLKDIVTVKRSTLNSISAGAVSAGLKSGEEMMLEDLLYCVMVSSANDAAAVVAEHVAGSQAAFVEKMNARAATLGCVNTNFTNVHGLQDERQYSTARDMAVIVADALKNEKFAYYFGVTEHTVAATNSTSARHLTTTNYMMNPDSVYYDSRVTGGKPAAATSSDRSIICTAKLDSSEYLCVVISAKAKMSGNAVTRYTNFDEAKKLLDMGFEDFAVQQVVGTQQPFGIYAVSGGENHVVVAPRNDVYALLPLSFSVEQLQFHDIRDESMLHAPIEAGMAVGSLRIYFESVLIGEVELIACHDVALLGTGILSGDLNTSHSIGIGGILIFVGVPVLFMVFMTIVVLPFVKHRRVRRCHNKTATNQRGER